MSLTHSTAVRNAIGNTAVGLIDQGTDNPNGRIEFWTTSKPANPQTPASGILLSTLQFSNPAYPSFINGGATVNPISSDLNIAASGACGWFRVYDCDGTPLWDGVVTVTGGGGDIEFDTINFVQGGTVHLTILDAIVPE